MTAARFLYFTDTDRSELLSVHSMDFPSAVFNDVMCSMWVGPVDLMLLKSWVLQGSMEWQSPLGDRSVLCVYCTIIVCVCVSSWRGTEANWGRRVQVMALSLDGTEQVCVCQFIHVRIQVPYLLKFFCAFFFPLCVFMCEGHTVWWNTANPTEVYMELSLISRSIICQMGLKIKITRFNFVWKLHCMNQTFLKIFLYCSPFLLTWIWTSAGNSQSPNFLHTVVHFVF